MSQPIFLFGRTSPAAEVEGAWSYPRPASYGPHPRRGGAGVAGRRIGRPTLPSPLDFEFAWVFAGRGGSHYLPSNQCGPDWRRRCLRVAPEVGIAQPENRNGGMRRHGWRAHNGSSGVRLI